MKTKSKIVIIIGIAAIVIIATLIGVLTVTDGTLDVIGKEAVTSFDKVLNTEGSLFS